MLELFLRHAANASSQPQVIIDLYKRHGIGKIRLYTPNPDVLQALRGSDVDVAIGIANEDSVPMATSLNFTKSWFSRFVEPYVKDVRFKFIILGNEAIPGKFGEFVAPAMKHMQAVLDYNELGSSNISVTTTVSTKVLQYTIPPSAGVFTPEALTQGLASVIDFLQHVSSYVLMVNVTTPALAATYNTNLVKHVVNCLGTPKRPGPIEIEAFIFGVFDENLDPNKDRRNFGIFNSTTLEPAYPLFTTTGNKHFKAAQRAGRGRNRRVQS